MVDHQFHVDEKLNSNLVINLDLVVNMPCKYLHTNVRDFTDDRFLANELLKFEGIPELYVPRSYKINQDSNHVPTPELDEVMGEGIVAKFRDQINQFNSEDAPVCHIYGSIPVNKVNGDFHITAKGYGYSDFTRQSIPMTDLNFTHVINEFSFGEFYPYIDNPLDATGQITEENLQAYQYYINVVPTVYKKLGVEIETNQFAVSLQRRKYSWENKGVPGIFFKYEFDPISLVVEDKRLSFMQFLIRLATIFGGIVILGKSFYRLSEKFILKVYGKKAAMKGVEKKGGILDKDLSAIE